jgi:hypothetical protein
MSVAGRGLGRTGIRALTEDAARTETGAESENAESVGRKRVGVREETRYSSNSLLTRPQAAESATYGK